MAKLEGEYEWDGEPLEDGDDVVRDYESGERTTEELRLDAASDIALASSGAGFVADEGFDDEGFNAQNNP